MDRTQSYRCRMKVPCVSDWVWVSAPTWQHAANEFHDRELATTYSIHVRGEESETGRWYRVYFAMVEVEGYGEVVSRIFVSGLGRKGGVRRRTLDQRLADMAKRLGWNGLPSELLGDGWEAEEEEWT